MRVAVVHHWFVTRGGGERVAECLASLLPTADLFTLVSSRRGVPASLRRRKMHTSFLSKVPFASRAHRHLMPLYPAAVRSLDLRDYDLIFSSDSGPIKGIRMRRDAIHLCYCHSPMRYLYDGYYQYRDNMGRLTRRLFEKAAPKVKQFDLASAPQVTAFIANSWYVRDRIQRIYHRDSAVIHPPVDLSLARRNPPGEHYLCAGRLVNYKKTELIISACRHLGRKLRVAGSGPEESRLRKIAGPETTFLGQLSDEDLWNEYSRCKALLFAADEDFGLVPLEVQACGRPVICFGFGGAVETVRDVDPPVRYAPFNQLAEDLARQHPTGAYFSPQTPQALVETMLKFEKEQHRYDPAFMEANAASFSTPIFLEQIRRFSTGLFPQLTPAFSDVESAMARLQAGTTVDASPMA